MEQQYGGYNQDRYHSQNPYDDRHEIRDDYGRGGYSNRTYLRVSPRLSQVTHSCLPSAPASAEPDMEMRSMMNNNSSNNYNYQPPNSGVYGLPSGPGGANRNPQSILDDCQALDR
ncbi:hypothetical protein LTS18_009512, partial [Coniosporium uncinatum]